MGPFTEAEVQSKLRSGELDTTAYVFSEGMSDWALVGETDVFAAKGPAIASAGPAPTPTPGPAAPSEPKAETIGQPVVKESISAGPAKSAVKVSAEPTLAKVKAEPAPKAAKKSGGGRPPVRRAVLYSLLGVVIVFSGVFYWIDQGGHVPFLSDLLNPSSKILPPPSPTPKPPLAVGENQEVSTATAAAPAPKPPRGFDWNELRDFRKTEDPKGPPFRIASHSLGDTRPVILGALSPLIRSGFVRVAIFPDNEKNLMPVAKIWTLVVPVLDGYFSVGPLNIEGAELPAGRYHLMAAAGESFLGEVTFDVGAWPSTDKLNELQLQLQQERKVLAEKERSALELKFREAAAAVDQLRLHGRSASLGPKGAKEWQRVSKPWRTNMLKALEDQRLVMGGPMFYADIQGRLYRLMVDTLKMEEALDMSSKGGPKAVLAARKKSLGQLWTELSQTQTALSGEIQILGQSAVTALRIDPEVIKKQLVTPATAAANEAR